MAQSMYCRWTADSRGRLVARWYVTQRPDPVPGATPGATGARMGATQLAGG